MIAKPWGEHKKLTTSPISPGGIRRPVVLLALSSVAVFKVLLFLIESKVPPAKQ